MWALMLVCVAYVAVPRSAAADIEAACKRAGLSIKQVATIYGVSQEQFYQHSRGQGHLSLWRLMQMKDDPDGRRFLRAYMPLVWRSMGLPDIQDALDLRDCVARMVDRLQIDLGRDLPGEDHEGAA